MRQAFHRGRLIPLGMLGRAMGVALALVGCSSPQSTVRGPATAQPAEVPPPAAAPVTPRAASSTPTAVTPQEVEAAAAQTARPAEAPAPAKSDTRPAPRDTHESGTRPKPTAQSPSTAPSGPAPAAPAPAPRAAAAAPQLDLTSLEQRLRDTRAIGVFTKLSLKNQVDDLLTAFRTFHAGHSPIGLSELRQRFDLLLLKVLSLLQDGDPPLATAISASREAIWGVLIDPHQFAKL